MAGTSYRKRARRVGAVTGGMILFATAVALADGGQAESLLRLAQAGPKASSTPAAPRAAPTYVLVFFDYEKSTFGQFAQPLVDRIAEQFKSTGAREVRIVAHTDAAERNSDALSLARASALRTALIAKSVPSQAIAIVGAGATSPLVPTAKGAKEPQNRRADVSLVP